MAKRPKFSGVKNAKSLLSSKNRDLQLLLNASIPVVLIVRALQ